MKPRTRNNPINGYIVVVKNGKLMVAKMDGGEQDAN